MIDVRNLRLQQLDKEDKVQKESCMVKTILKKSTVQ